MINFSAIVEKFGKKGEKSGWTYILISPETAEMINPGCKKSFRVKGKLRNYKIEKTAVMPMGNGDFILPLNASMRKGIGCVVGEKLDVGLEADNREIEIDADLIACLAEENEALEIFNSLPPSHRKYYSNWVQSAKTEVTRAKRIGLTINAMLKKQDFGQMLRDERSRSKK